VPILADNIQEACNELEKRKNFSEVDYAYLLKKSEG